MYQQRKDPGLGEKYKAETKRVINKDGSFNVKYIGKNTRVKNLYHLMMMMPWWKFMTGIFIAYLLINCFFASIYYLIGVSDIGSGASNDLEAFMDAFFFSVQTLTTIGYGAMAPHGIASHTVATIEALLGVLSFAIGTGIFYGRFARPSAEILFSDNAIIHRANNKSYLQFRIVNRRKNILMDVEATVILVWTGENFQRHYFQLDLETSQIVFFPMNWTLVHEITKESPLYNKEHDALLAMNAELLVLIKGFDDSFNQLVHTRYSYRWDEVIWDQKFTRAFHTNQDGDIIMDVDKIHDIKPNE